MHVFRLGWIQIFSHPVSVVTSWPGFLTQWHTYWGGLFELPLFTREPVPTSSGDSDTVPSHKDVHCHTTLLLSEQKERHFYLFSLPERSNTQVLLMMALAATL